MDFDTVWTNGNVATLSPTAGGAADYGVVLDGAVAARDGTIVWVGPRRDLPASPAIREYDLDGGWLLPGFVDCHTHLVFAGSRAEEFERRLAGESYAEIARSGGGIRSTVVGTRKASEDDLFESAASRVRALLAEGVTTLEVKSGYGLDRDTEVRMLRVIRRLGRSLPCTVRSTFLGAHALPAEFEGRADEYVEYVIASVLPAVLVEGLADQIDAFLEDIAFDAGQCRRLLVAGAGAGLGVRLHADQLSDGNGAGLAAELGARSADHLEYTSSDGVRAMAAHGTTAVLLPAAFYTLRETRVPPVEEFREQGVPIAVASDINPGSAPFRSFLLALNMASVLFRLRPDEVLKGATSVAAEVLGLVDRGRVAPGQRADLASWRIDHPRDLCYWAGGNPCGGSWVAGDPVTLSRAPL